MSYFRTSAALLSMCVLLGACDGKSLSLQIDESRVQERVVQKFPQEHDLRGLATLTMTNPVVDLRTTPDRIGLTADLELARPGIPLAIKGSAKTSGTVRYEPTKHTFYMTDVRVEQLDIASTLLSEERKKSLIDLTNAALQSSLKDIPVYTLETGVSRSAADSLLQNVSVKDGKLLITMGPKG